MKVFTRDYRITGDYHPLWNDYFGGMKPCVLDIETTGLSRQNCKVILVGLLVPNESGVVATQFLAENHYEEYKVLDAVLDFLESENIGYLITYNGASFDVPFLDARLEACLGAGPLGLYDFDLYRFLKCSTDLKSRISSLSQKSVENYFGILSDRGDTISGRESVLMFDQYALSGNSTLEKIILTHNREDILHLHRLMYLVMAEFFGSRKHMDSGAQNDHAADRLGLHSAMASYGFPAADGRLSVRPSLKQTGSGLLKIKGTQLRDPVSCAFFPDIDSPLTATFSATSSSFEIDAPLGRLDDDFYMDISFFFNNPLFNGLPDESPHGPEAASLLRSDPDCVNGFLIMNPRTINLISRILAERFV